MFCQRYVKAVNPQRHLYDDSVQLPSPKMQACYFSLSSRNVTVVLKSKVLRTSHARLSRELVSHVSLQVMCGASAIDPVKQDWLGRAVLLLVLHLLTLGARSLGSYDVFSDLALKFQS